MTIIEEPYRPRILYGTLFAWMAVTGGRFLAPFLEHEAMFSDAWIGTTLACQYGLLSILAPFYGLYADRQEQIHPHWGRGKVLMWGVGIGNVMFLLHGLHHFLAPHGDESLQGVFHSIPYHILVQCGYAACFAIMFPVLDGMTVDDLQKRSEGGGQQGGGSMDYGKERLYGAISWGVTNLLFGPLIDKFGMVAYYPCSILTAFLSLVSIYIYNQSHASAATAAAAASFLPTIPMALDDHHPPAAGSHNTNTLILQHNNVNKNHENENEKAVKSNQNNNRASTIQLTMIVFGTVYGAAFLCCYFLLNIGFSVVENMVFLFFEFLGGSNTLCSITVALTVIFEIPVFGLAPKILREYGVGWLLLLANVAFWIRVVGYTFIPQGQGRWLVFFLEPLHGFTYAGAQSAVVEFVNQNVAVGREASGQGIVNLVRGLANVMGLWLGGMLQYAFGPRLMYRVFVAAVTVGMTIFATIRSCTDYGIQYEKQQQLQKHQYQSIPDVGANEIMPP